MSKITRKEAKQILFKFVDKFKEYIEDVEKLIGNTQEERDELFMSSAISLDFQLKEFYGFAELDIEYLFGITFKERAIRFLEARGKKVKQDKLLAPKIKEISTREKRVYAISERATNFIFGQSKFMDGLITVKADEKTMGLLFDKYRENLDANMMKLFDLICENISNKWGFDKSKDDKDIVLFKNPDAFTNFLANSEMKKKPTVWSLKLKASEVRREFGDSKLTIKDIVILFDRWKHIFFDMTAKSMPILRDPEKGKWCRISTASPLFRLVKREIGTISNRWQTKDYLLELRFSTEYPLGWIVIGNLSCGRGGRLTLPVEAYRGKEKLSSYQQNILREIRLWKMLPAYTILYWGKIAGYTTKKIWRLKELLQKDFSILKSKKHIEDFKISGRGVKAIIKILK